MQGKESHTGRNTTLLVTGSAIGTAHEPVHRAPDARSWLKEKVFGPEQTFSYDEQPSGNGDPAPDHAGASKAG